MLIDRLYTCPAKPRLARRAAKSAHTHTHTRGKSVEKNSHHPHTIGSQHSITSTPPTQTFTCTLSQNASHPHRLPPLSFALSPPLCEGGPLGRPAEKFDRHCIRLAHTYQHHRFPLHSFPTPPPPHTLRLRTVESRKTAKNAKPSIKKSATQASRHTGRQAGRQTGRQISRHSSVTTHVTSVARSQKLDIDLEQRTHSTRNERKATTHWKEEKTESASTRRPSAAGARLVPRQRRW